ncbi:MAG TPA: hypothetical protein PKJ15_00495 [Methanomassiliicoccales archaeon]|nr:hypothetical protein [Methanomassiliicoccales archaeon]
MEMLSLKNEPLEIKVAILEKMGYSSDGTFILDSKGNLVIDPYIDEAVRIDNMVILHGSEVILDSNPLSLAGYFEDHGEVF